jgi:DNA-directed RNA polymerase specialized sigma54-like protein
MAKLNITQAAQAVGKHRSTLQRNIKEGKLSVEKDGLGNPVIDVAELQRVFGHVAIDATGVPLPQNATVHQPVAPPNDAKIKLLEQKLQATERERDEAQRREREERDRHQETKELRDRLLNVIEEQSKTIAALPAANPETRKSEELPAKRGFWRRLFNAGS